MSHLPLEGSPELAEALASAIRELVGDSLDLDIDALSIELADVAYRLRFVSRGGSH